MTLDENTFETLADATLARFQETIEETLGDHLDVDLQGGILTIELDSGGQYVVNKHAPNRQIWVSSPVSGASHYDYDPATEGWRSTRGDVTLADLLARELMAATGASLTLD